MQCTLSLIKKTKQFEEKNVAFSLKEVTEKGIKTVGGASCNLVDVVDQDVLLNLVNNNNAQQQASKVFASEFLLQSKSHKGLKLTVTFRSECVKINSQFMMRAENPVWESDEEEEIASFDDDEENEDENTKSNSATPPDKLPSLLSKSADSHPTLIIDSTVNENDDVITPQENVGNNSSNVFERPKTVRRVMSTVFPLKAPNKSPTLGLNLSLGAKEGALFRSASSKISSSSFAIQSTSPAPPSNNISLTPAPKPIASTPTPLTLDPPPESPRSNRKPLPPLPLTPSPSANFGEDQKLKVLLMEKDLTIAKLLKHIEVLTQGTVTGEQAGADGLEKVNEKMREREVKLRLSLLQDLIYNPDTFKYTYDSEGGCYSEAALILHENLLRTNLLYGAAPENAKVLDRIVSCMRCSSKARDSSMYWFSSTCGILHKVCDTVHLAAQNETDPCVKGLKALYCHVSPTQGLENISEFISRVQHLSTDLYHEIITSLCKQVDALLMTVFLGRNTTLPKSPKLIAIPKSPKGSKSPKLSTCASTSDSGPDIAGLKSFFENLVDKLLDHRIFPILAGDVIMQVLEYMDETTFNLVMSQKKLYSADGVRMKIASLQFEHWIKDSRAEIWLSKRQVSILKYVQEVANLIMVDKEKLESTEFIQTTFKHLNLKQILHVVEAFNNDESTKKNAPSVVVKFLTGQLKLTPNVPLLLSGAFPSPNSPTS